MRSLEDHHQQSSPSLPSAPHQPEINRGQGGAFTRNQAAPWSRGHGGPLHLRHDVLSDRTKRSRHGLPAPRISPRIWTNIRANTHPGCV